MIEIPKAVRAAAATRMRSQPLAPAPIARGDIRVVVSDSASRLVLVLSVDSDNEFADVLLVHSAPELATSSDGVLSAADFDLPYPLVVQTDLRAAVWTLQLREAIGHVPDGAFAQLNAVVRGDGPAPKSGVTSAFALSGPTDRRWGFKQQEGRTLRRIAHECTSALLDQGLIWEVDARLLNPELLALADDPLRLSDPW